MLDAKGRIITNNHVVAGAADGTSIRVVFADGRRQTAKLLGRSPSYDIAVIKVKPSGSLHPVDVGDSARTQVGEPVIAVGSPLGLPGTVTQGIVSARHRPVVVNAGYDADSPTAYIDAIQTDAPINPGNSGGPLVDGRARIIGVNSAILTMGSAQGGQTGNIGLGFAIPINQATTIGSVVDQEGHGHLSGHRGDRRRRLGRGRADVGRGPRTGRPGGLAAGRSDHPDRRHQDHRHGGTHRHDPHPAARAEGRAGLQARQPAEAGTGSPSAARRADR